MCLWTRNISLNFGSNLFLDREDLKNEQLHVRRTVYCLLVKTATPFAVVVTAACGGLELLIADYITVLFHIK